MTYEINYSSDQKILTRTFKGPIAFKEVMESWNELILDGKLDPPVTGILNDFTNAKLNMDVHNLKQMMEYFDGHGEIFGRIRLAAVMILPENIVLPVLASEHYPQYKIQAFSTIDAAEAWLRIGD